MATRMAVELCRYSEECEKVKNVFRMVAQALSHRVALRYRVLQMQIGKRVWRPQLFLKPVLRDVKLKHPDSVIRFVWHMQYDL